MWLVRRYGRFMKLSVFTTVTNPSERGDNWSDAFQNYMDLADELVIVSGGGKIGRHEAVRRIKVIKSVWPREFSWEFIGQQFTRGYEACTGDAVIHADLDFIFNEKDFSAIRKAAQTMLDNKWPAMSFYKYQFVLPDRYNLKSRLVIMVNKRDYGDRIRFDSSGDLCQPSLDGKYLSPDDVPEAHIPFYCYEKLLKTKEQIADDQGRMERAWHRHFGEYQMKSDGTNESAYNKWIQAQIGKFNKPQKQIKLEEHPIFIQETIKNLKPENFGFSGHGHLGENNYVRK